MGLPADQRYAGSRPGAACQRFGRGSRAARGGLRNGGRSDAAAPGSRAAFRTGTPNQLWQTDLFTFVLKRQNRRLHLVAFMDDHSRFLVSFGLHASASTALVLEALEAGIASYGPPEEILTDNGPQYVTWRGKSQFTKHLEKRGIRQIVARPRRPQTLGKIERFWGTLWREFLETAVFVDLADARTRIGLFVDYYNFQRVHRGIDGVVPADRFFGAASEVLRTLKERVAANALELARHGTPQRPFYVTGQVDGKPFSVHAEGQRLILRREDGQREEVTLSDAPTRRREKSCPIRCARTAPRRCHRANRPSRHRYRRANPVWMDRLPRSGRRKNRMPQIGKRKNRKEVTNDGHHRKEEGFFDASHRPPPMPNVARP